MGFDRSDLRRLIEQWPIPQDRELLDDAANNVLNMLLGYPHRAWGSWASYSDASPRDLAALLMKWRGQFVYRSVGARHLRSDALVASGWMKDRMTFGDAD